MTTFKEIRGKLIRTLDTDPTPATTYEGEIWYNKTIGVLKGVVSLGGVWSSGGNLTTARSHVSGAGTQTAGLAVAGDTADNVFTNATEEYNGSAWTSGGNYPTSIERTASSGTQTAAITAGGANPSPTTTAADYDGTSWAATNPLNQARYDLGAAGTQVAGLFFGGATYPPITYYTNTEEYDGTSFTNGNGLNTARAMLRAGAGIQTAAITASGRPGPSANTLSEEYDGTSWTATSPTTEAKNSRQSFGSTSSAILAGGTPTPFTGTEKWDGTSWSSTPASLSTSQFTGGSTKNNTSSSGAIWGGQAPGNTNVTQEYDDPVYGTRTLTTS